MLMLLTCWLTLGQLGHSGWLASLRGIGALVVGGWRLCSARTLILLANQQQQDAHKQQTCSSFALFCVPPQAERKLKSEMELAQ